MLCRTNRTPGVAWMGWLVLCGSAVAAECIDIGSRRELFVDHFLIDKMTNVRLELHHPQWAGVAATNDFPWEGKHGFAYATVLKDGDLYRMYYRGSFDLVADGSAGEVTCYAESRDGIRWTKPKLGLFEVAGSRKNNCVLAGMPPYSHNFAPFIDTKPGVPPAERYKALAGIESSGLTAFVSANGLRWKKLRDEPVLKEKGWVYDSQNVAFWSDSEKCYVCYFRRCPEGVRAIARATSPDLIHWSPLVQMEYGTAGTKPPQHLYINQTQPYFRAPHLYVGLAARFMEGRRALDDAQVRTLGIDAKSWLKNDCSDAVLLTSRGGTRYERTFMEAFIRPGPGLENWVSRTNYPARGIVPTGPAEISLYLTRHNGQKSNHLARYTLRTDGFASVHASYEQGEMLTRPFHFTGKELEINFSTSAAGSVRVEIQDADGKPIPGRQLDQCPEIIGDEIGRIVRWKEGSDVSALAGKPIRLRFVLKEADLYALCFR